MSQTILTLRHRAPEIGRLRMGRKVPTGNGRSRPERLEAWRLTSPNRLALEAAASVYGGDVQPWADAPGEQAQHELFTDAVALRILIPLREPVSQAYELWSGGGCQRRCDGQREAISDQPCICAGETDDPREFACKPTTRLNVLLPELPGLGVWRLETHGYYAAVELAGLAELLASSGQLIPAELRIEQRTIKRPGTAPKHFAVPVLDVAMTVGEVVTFGSGGSHAALDSARRELEAPQDSPGPAAMTPPAGPGVPTIEQIEGLRSIEQAQSLVTVAPEPYQQAVRAVFASDAAWRRFWKSEASVSGWKSVLRVALEQSDPASPEAPHGTEAGSDPTPGGRGSGTADAAAAPGTQPPATPTASLGEQAGQNSPPADVRKGKPHQTGGETLLDEEGDTS